MDAVAPAAFSLDPQLARDTVPVGELPLSRVLLMNDANFPWLIAVPRRVGAIEIFDLDDAARELIADEIILLAQVLKQVTGCDKVNVAAIGNVVSQLHVHVVARRHTDAAWPKPVWGALPARPYEEAARERLIDAIRREVAFG